MRESRFLAVLLFVSVLILTSCGGGAGSSSSQPQQQTPNFSSATSKVDFGSQLANGGTQKKSVTVTNSGNGNLVISAISVTGTSAKDFSFSAPTMPITVVANSSLKLDIMFTPVESGTLTASLNITDNAGGSPHTIALSGIGTAPLLAVNPNSVQFGAGAVNGGAISRTVVLDNSNGTGDLMISNISVSGTNSSDFSTSAGSMTVKAGTHKQLTVAFAAGAAGARTASLVLTDNAAGSPHSISLSGTGVTGPAQNPNATIAVSPDTTANVPGPVTVTITGTGTNFVAGATVANFGPGATVTDGSLGATGVSGAYGTVNVTGPTTATAQVTFDSTAAAGPRFVMLTTDGVHFSTATFLVPAHGGPVANAGASQFIDLGTGNVTVHMDGSASGAVESNPIARVHANAGSSANPLLTYQWTFLGLPEGSTATFDDPSAVRPTFIADKAGDYLVQLSVTDGSGKTTSTWVLLSSLFSLPVAHAGDSQFVTTGATVQLDGSGSTDAKGSLTYQWQFLSVPNGSSAALSNPAAVAPTFVADLAGDYRVRLIVSDGQGNTASDTVLITTSKTPPVAKAGANQKVSLNDQPQLDGSASFDPDGDTLTCSWSLLSLPSGSAAQLTNAGPGACSTKASFTVDQPGSYIAQLVVTDTDHNSSVATVLLTTDDPGPIANAGLHQLVNIGETANLDGSASLSPAGGNITYSWSVLFKPSTSSVTITNPTSATASFVPDVTGDYVFQLIVTDSLGLASAPATVRISAATPGFSIDHTTLNFGSQTVNTTSDSNPIVVTNTGNGILTITSIDKNGPQAGEFAFTSAALPVTVGPGASTTINVTFSPSAGGPRSASLTINNNAIPPVTVQLSGTGGVPVSQFSTNSLNFGGQVVGIASAPQTVTINNTGTGTLSISSITLIGSQPGDFSVSPNTKQDVAPGSSLTLSATFKPTQAGGRSAVISIVDNASASAETISLSGTGTAPGISANPNSVTFTDQLIHTTSAATPITITNTGTADLHITGLSTDIGDFATSTPFPITVAPSNTTQINVTFTPTVAGNRSGTLSITYDAGTYTVVLTGRSIAPDIDADKTVSFPDTLVGNTSLMTINITNSGTAPLTVNSVAGVTAVVVSDTTNYQVVDAPTAPIAPGSSASAHIKFKPTTRGSHPATVTIPSDAVSGPATVSLSGTGLQPGISLDRTTLTFGNQLLNAASSPLIVTVTNNGNSPLNISALTLSGANATDFSSTTSVPFSVPAGQIAQIAVVFTPAGLGARNANLRITNDAGAPVDVTLSGAGVQPGITVQPSLSFGNQTVSTTGNSTLTITNPGTAPLHINSLVITTNATEFGVTTAAPVVVPANNGTATINLTFTPSQIGNRSGTLTIGSDAPGSPTTVSLSGTGTGAVITVTPNPLSFGSQLVTVTSAPGSITIKNDGNANLTITGLAIGGTNAGDFSFFSGFTPPTPGTPLTVGPGLSANVPFVFTPAAIGNRAATLTISANTAAPLVQLTGNGTAPGAPTFNPAPVTFVQVLGTTSAGVPVTVTNPASASGNLIITNIGISGANAGDFATTTVATTLNPISIAPGTSAVINLTFTPGAAGARSGLLTITDNAPVPGSTHSVTLSGTGAVSNITPTTLPFNGQVVGTTSAAQTITFAYPTGASGSLTFNSFAITGPNAADFNATIGLPAPPFTITSGQRQISVTFTPSAGVTAARSANLTITDSTGTQTVALTGTALSPSFSAAPIPLTFPDTLVNATSVATTLTITNNGTATLHISAFTITPSTTEFSVTTPANFDIPAGQSAPVNLTFKPSTTGVRSATLNITDNATGSPHTVALSGNGVASAISLSPSPVAFGNQTINVVSNPIQVTITNPGTAPLTISAITSSNPDFTFSPSAPITVQPGAGNSATLNVTFKPSIGTTESATLTFTDNTLAGTHTLSLSGTGVVPGIFVSPSPVQFANQALLTPSTPMTITITNNGLGTLVISNLAISGTNSADFAFPASFVPHYPINVAANSSTQVPVVFTPSVEAAETATLSITSNANPTSVTLNGTGVAPHFSASPSPLNFTATAVGSNQSQTLTITNSGGADMIISGIAKSGVNAADFAVTQTTPITVPKNSFVSLTVVFTPSANGSEAAILTFTDNASNSPQTVNLTGSGTAPVMGPLPAFTFPSSVFVGSTSAPQSYQISNTGSAPLKIFGLSLTGTNASEFAVISQMPTQQNPLIVAAGGFSSITLTFSPTVVGTRTATLVITDNTGPGGATVSTDHVDLTATGKPLQANPSYNPTTLTFTPNQKVGTSSAALTIGVTNNGNGDMTINTAVFSGATPGDFQVTNPLPLTVPKNGGSVGLNVVFTPTDQGSRTATLTINATNVSDGVALPAQTVSVGGTGFYVGHFSLNSTSLGANLQILATGAIDVPPSVNLPVTITSSNPSLVVVEPIASDPSGTLQGSGSFNGTVPKNTFFLPGFFIQALASSGTATITVSSPGSGYQTATATVTLTPSGFVLIGPGGTGNNFTASLGADSSIKVGPVQLDSSGNVMANSVAVRGGSPITVAINSATPAVGTITTNPVIQPGTLVSNTVSFHPVSGGTTVLSIVQPAGFSTPTSGAQVTATVQAPTITLNPLTIGFNQQSLVTGQLNQSSPTAVTVNISSSDSNKMLLTTNPNAIGTGTITVTVPANSTQMPAFYAQSLVSGGTATITASASGYSDGIGNVALNKSAFALFGPDNTINNFSTTSISQPSSLTLTLYMLDQNSNMLSPGTLRPGVSFNVTVNSSATATATIVGNPAAFTSGMTSNTNLSLQPQANCAVPCTTNLTVVQPTGFSIPAAGGGMTVTVNKPSLSLIAANTLVGQNLQVLSSGSLDAGYPFDTLRVTITSDNPNVLLSASPTAAGSTSVTLSVPPNAGVGGHSFPPYYVQSVNLASGTATLTATVKTQTNNTDAGYNVVPLTFSFAPAGFQLSGRNGAGQAMDAGINSSFGLSVYAVVLDTTLTPTTLSEVVRGGLFVPITATSDSGNATPTSPIFISGGSGSQDIPGTINVTTGSTPQQTTTISIGTPSGFATPVTGTQVPVFIH